MTPAEFQAAVEKIIGMPPNNHVEGSPMLWILPINEHCQLAVGFHDERYPFHLLMRFNGFSPGIGENPHSGQWQIRANDFNDDPEAVLRELARRLAAAGYEPPSVSASNHPRIDMVLENIDQSGLRGSDAFEILEQHAKKIEEELHTLARWKAEALEVEKQWDVQAIGKEIPGLTLGDHVRPAILPYIQGLKAAAKAESGLLDWLENNWQEFEGIVVRGTGTVREIIQRAIDEES